MSFFHFCLSAARNLSLFLACTAQILPFICFLLSVIFHPQSRALVRQQIVSPAFPSHILIENGKVSEQVGC